MGKLGSLWGIKGTVWVLWNTSPSRNFSNYDTSLYFMGCEPYCLNFQSFVRVLTYISSDD